ncbi:autotransporter domain-containing protein [Roseibium sediminis]|uniref:autotransporter family protein n=1 Tax=Roseibium sediminis TaxID=1775174 RepID=UPI001375D414|nr:autotransporter domain-containing protein [Roseibium sediminis]
MKMLSVNNCTLLGFVSLGAILASSAPSAASCAVLGAGTYLAGGAVSVPPSHMSPSRTYCLTSRAEFTFPNAGPIPSDGLLEVYSPVFFDLNRAGGRVHSFVFVNNTIEGSATPNTPFLRTHVTPGTTSLGAMYINLFDTTIGENRSISLVQESGNTQFQNVYFASLKSGTTLAYKKLTISNPSLLAIGQYNIIGQDFYTPVNVHLEDSSVTGARVVGVQAGSTLDLKNTTINTQFFSLTGTLSGNGTINGKSGGSDVNFLSANGATFRPGNSIGTLTINGNLSLQGATNLVSELDPGAGQNADLLSVSGNVTGASKLTVTLEKDSGYAGGTGAAEITAFTGANYTVVTAGSIDSDGVTLAEGASLNAHLTPRLVGSPSGTGNIVVTFDDNSPTPTHLPSKVQTLHPSKVATTSTPAVTLTSSVAATHHATVVNGTTGGSGGGGQILANGQTLSTAFLSLTNANLLQLNEVHAEPYSSNLTVALEQADHVASTVMNRISGSPNVLEDNLVVRDAQGRAIWLDVSGVLGNVEGKDGLGNFGYQLANVMAGADILASEAGSIGAFAGYGYHRMTEHDHVDQSFSAHAGYAGLYGTFFSGAWNFSGAAGYSYAANSSSRNNPDVGLFTGGKAEADFGSHTAFVSAKAGYAFGATETLVLNPFVAASYAHIWQDAVRETGGGDFNYRINSATADALMTGLGLEMSSQVYQDEVTSVRMQGFLRYDHDWSASRASAHEVTAVSHLFGSFTQAGQNRGSHSLSAGFGFSGRALDNRLNWRAGLAGSIHEHGEEIGAGAQISWRF